MCWPSFLVMLQPKRQARPNAVSCRISPQLRIEEAPVPLSIEFETSQLIVIRSEGMLRRSEVDEAKRAVFSRMQEHGKQHVLVMIDQDFSNLEPDATWEDIEEDAYIQRHIIRMAIVGDLRWRDRAMLFFLNAIGGFPIDYFNADQEPLARAWLLH